MTCADSLAAPRYRGVSLAQGSTLRVSRDYARTRRGLVLLRMWMRKHWDWGLEISPGRVARDLGLGSGAATDIGYALSSLARRGYAEKIGEHPARYLLTPLFFMVVENHGCLVRDECDSNTACGLIGTKECPFLEGYEGW